MIGKDGKERKGLFDIKIDTPGYGLNTRNCHLEDRFPKTVFVHFESEADIEDFSRLIGKRINKLTKAIWYKETGEKEE